MGFEMALLLFAAAAIAAYGLIRRRKAGFREDERQDVLECVVTFFDRQQTLQWIETYFETAHIRVENLERQIESGEGVDLYTNVYRLRLPRSVSPAELVGHLSGCDTVQSVHINPV